ncbi:hypothetical protein HV319_23095 [Citrobacter freundii]|uniref:hypothetical protein n=1 Tax=Citrobacter freundii TaxID=546 RepID=UPI0015E9A76D|nr:hypothetical protein [Citrobacter freundii]QLR90009.1 hypothetical protein HV330_23075 [Citrobacter freundii]QLS37796.1 hypothetical protein HV319_23095 [Citrobacter freundii]
MTKSTNHPAQGPVSVDRLHQIREHLQHDTQYSNGGNRAYILADMLKVIDEALTASNTQPVAWTDAEELRDLEHDGCGAMLSLNRKDCEHADPRRQILPFTHPAPLRNAEREELQELRRNYQALRCEIEDVQSQLYEAENQANEYARELQERRRADSSEPVLYAMQGVKLDTDAVSTCKNVVDSWVDEWNQERKPGMAEYKTVPLYAAPLAPVVPEEITSASAPEVFEIASEAERLGLRGTYASYAVGWNACRAAMLNRGKS